MNSVEYEDSRCWVCGKQHNHSADECLEDFLELEHDEQETAADGRLDFMS